MSFKDISLQFNNNENLILQDIELNINKIFNFLKGKLIISTNRENEFEPVITDFISLVLETIKSQIFENME
jgi:hypothetical protein